MAEDLTQKYDELTGLIQKKTGRRRSANYDDAMADLDALVRKYKVPFNEAKKLREILWDSFGLVAAGTFHYSSSALKQFAKNYATAKKYIDGLH